MTTRVVDEREHRRGLILGLTLAEVLLLLLFVLLLALSFALKQQSEINRNLRAATQELKPLLERLQNDKLTPEQIESLAAQLGRLRELQADLLLAKRANASLQDQLTNYKTLAGDASRARELDAILHSAKRLNANDPLTAIRNALAAELEKDPNTDNLRLIRGAIHNGSRARELDAILTSASELSPNDPLEALKRALAALDLWARALTAEQLEVIKPYASDSSRGREFEQALRAATKIDPNDPSGVLKNAVATFESIGKNLTSNRRLTLESFLSDESKANDFTSILRTATRIGPLDPVAVLKKALANLELQNNRLTPIELGELSARLAKISDLENDLAEYKAENRQLQEELAKRKAIGDDGSRRRELDAILKRASQIDPSDPIRALREALNRLELNHKSSFVPLSEPLKSLMSEGSQARELETVLQRAASIDPNDPPAVLRRALDNAELVTKGVKLDQLSTLKPFVSDESKAREFEDVLRAATKIDPNDPPEALKRAIAAFQAQARDGSTEQSKTLSGLNSENSTLKKALKIAEQQRDNLIRQGNGKGTTFPSCWIGPENQNEYIFDVSIRDAGLIIRDIGPAYRGNDPAWKLVDEFPRNSPILPTRFRAATKRLFAASNTQKCRFFVNLRDESGPSKEQYIQLRTLVENHFYIRLLSDPYQPR